MDRTYEQIRKFYQNKMNNRNLFDYGPNGDLVELGKDGSIIADKTIVLTQHRDATAEEKQEVINEYNSELQDAVEAYSDAYIALWQEHQNSEATMESIYEYNQAVERADMNLKLKRFRNYHVERVEYNDKDVPTEKRINMRQLHFEKALDKNVQDTIAIVQTGAIQSQARFRSVANTTVSISEAIGIGAKQEQIVQSAKDILDSAGIQTEVLKKRRPAFKRAVPSPAVPSSVVPSSAAPSPAVPSSVVASPVVLNPALSKTVTTPAGPVKSTSSRPTFKRTQLPIKIENIKIENNTLKKSLTEMENKPKIAFKRTNVPNVPMGKVYIASMNLRGTWAPKPSASIKVVNVTSAQASASLTRRDFSPMTEIEGGYNGFWNFESYWQSGKVFEGIPEATTKKWWKAQNTAKRRYPGSKGKKVLYSSWPTHGNKHMDWVTSRKEVYVPEYFELMKDTESAIELQKYVASGKDIIIYDFDGPRLADGSVTTVELTPELLQEKINALDFPFGHGYIVGAWLKRITPDQYIM